MLEMMCSELSKIILLLQGAKLIPWECPTSGAQYPRNHKVADDCSDIIFENFL